jgi:hypothetical protein
MFPKLSTTTLFTKPIVADVAGPPSPAPPVTVPRPTAVLICRGRANTEEGDAEGFKLGASDGTTLGVRVGDSVVGVTVGAIDGQVGTDEGSVLGKQDG